jgi:glycosyltransferase involved in cell wall biosynthesis
MSPPIILTFSPFYLPGYKAGGPIRTIANMVSHIGEKFQFKIFTSDRDFLDTQPYPGITVNDWNRVGNAMVYYCSTENFSPLTIFKILTETQYDMLYLNSFFSPKFTIVPLLFRRLRLVPGKPTILAPRGELANAALKLKGYKKKLYLFAIRIIDLYGGITWHASTLHEKRDIIKTFGSVSQLAVPEQIMIAENLPALHHDLPGKINSKERGRLNIIFLSRICRMKNLKLALDVLGRVKGSISFHIYGPIDDPDYWGQCRHMIRDLPENVKAQYRGAVKNTEVIEVLGKYDLFFLPTLGENFGHVIWEAMIAGCPVMISDRTPWHGLREMGVGWDLPLSEIDSFQEIIENCVDMDQEEHLSWSMRARYYALSKMRGGEAAEMNISLFRSVLSTDDDT